MTVDDINQGKVANSYGISSNNNSSNKKNNDRKSLSYSIISEDTIDEIVLPPLKPRISSSRQSISSTLTPPSDKTPLVGRKQKKQSIGRRAKRLFGWNDISWRKTSPTRNDSREGGLMQYLFGFMYEDLIPDSLEPPSLSEEDVIVLSVTERQRFAQKLALSISLLLSSTANAIPVTLLTPIAQTWISQDNNSDLDLSNFTSKATALSILGLSIGKFVNGPMGEIFGARKISIIYSLFLSFSLILLSMSWNEQFSLNACFLIEFSQSVQWPMVIVILASHCSGNEFESGIYSLFLSTNFGSLFSIPITSFLLRYNSWRVIASLASLFSMGSALITLLFVRDSPGKVNDPQNPIQPEILSKFKLNTNFLRKIAMEVLTKAVSSVQMVVMNPIFWIVSISHAGDAMVRSSGRILGLYYYETSNGGISESKASILSVVLSVGTISGLVIAGTLFTSWDSPHARKKLIIRLYLTAIASCYLLAILAIPKVQYCMGNDTGFILIFQLIITFAMGFGTAVQSYIPGIIGTSFGNKKGIFIAYADSIAYGLSYLVWRVVNSSVSKSNNSTIGWTYGWAAVALLVIVCALMMLEFFDYYFIRRRCIKPKDNAERGYYGTIFFV